MKKKAAIWIVAGVLLAGAGGYGILVAQRGFPVGTGEVVDAVARANYCSTRVDCTVSPGDCPFSYEPVNVKEMPKIGELYRRYFAWEHRCMTSEFDNRDFARIDCVNGKCVVPEKPRTSAAGAPAAPLQPWK